MSDRHPEVFISATSADLHSCRQLAKEALLTLGCVPVEQTNFPPDYRTVREMLRAKISGCHAVVHLVGECYGAEPEARDPSAPRRSYTQMEYDLARELKKPVYVFICGEGFPYDAHPPEEAEKQRRQQAHRAALSRGETLRYTVLSPDDLSLRVRELQTQVEHLRGELRKTRSWLGRGLTLGLLALAVLGAGLWWLNRRTSKTEIRTVALETELDRQRRYIKAVADVYTAQETELDRLKIKLSDAEKYSRALATVARQEKVPEADVSNGINLFVATTRTDPKAPLADRELAAFAQENFLAKAPEPEVKKPVAPVPPPPPPTPPAPVVAAKKPDLGVTDHEIKIGTLTTSAGAASAYRTIALAEAAYFRMVNDGGGINGRKITFVEVENDSDSDHALDLARNLVEEKGVLLIFSSIGTENNLAMRAYLNEAKVPQLFVSSSSGLFDDPAHFPWTMGFFATYRTEGLDYAKYILKNRPGAKIAVLYADDSAGKEYLAGVRAGLGDKASAMIVKEATYQAADEQLDSQIADLKRSQADVFLNMAMGAIAPKAIGEAYDLDWHPLQFIPNASVSIAAFLDSAGLKKAVGIISNARSKSSSTAQAQSDPDVRAYVEWMKKYNAEGSLRDQNYLAGYERAEALVEVLRKCGDDLTRANVMRQAAHLDLQLGMLRPGITVKTSPTDYQPIKQMILMKFNGRTWIPFGSVIGGGS